MAIHVALVVALVLAAAAAIADLRTGRIANWITLPGVLASPGFYALILGPRHGVVCALSMVLCALVPYAMFRHEGMGGGDVKLFAALGAVTGFDIRIGLEIELVALSVAALSALIMLARRGALLCTLRRLFGVGRSLVRRSRREDPIPRELLTPIRLGVPIWIGTTIVVLPMLIRGLSV